MVLDNWSRQVSPLSSPYSILNIRCCTSRTLDFLQKKCCRQLEEVHGSLTSKRKWLVFAKYPPNNNGKVRTYSKSCIESIILIEQIKNVSIILRGFIAMLGIALKSHYSSKVVSRFDLLRISGWYYSSIETFYINLVHFIFLNSWLFHFFLWFFLSETFLIYLPSQRNMKFQEII